MQAGISLECKWRLITNHENERPWNESLVRRLGLLIESNSTEPYSQSKLFLVGCCILCGIIDFIDFLQAAFWMIAVLFTIKIRLKNAK